MYCLDNSYISLLPAIAKKHPSSSLQAERILLIKELIMHSKSYVEEPVDHFKHPKIPQNLV